MKNYYKYLILFSFCLIAFFLLWWQITNGEESREIGPISFIDKNEMMAPDPAPVACEVDEDCKTDTAVVHCPAEARCVDKVCQVYCVYDDVSDLEPFSVSDCQDEIDPLTVRPEEYQLKWLNANDLRIAFNIVLSCNIDNLSGSYELDDNNKITLNYEYTIKEAGDRCLCVRQLKYRIPNLDQLLNYEIIINKIEK